ncbi:HNH endonuclease signature motif containing protein [Marinimicrobium agarilyticum]|uniref:HNH endonuclease signature motif containing protein n=1 Tax=Marinimicrobium agarilyticum TaxID=306546 RepID=UPI000485EADD|nr:HNH endonuclease signature motif containing protein [Marinimicrobium agarilyticum]
MMRMNDPELSINDTLAACINGASRLPHKQRLISSANDLEQESDRYRTLGLTGDLYLIPALVTDRAYNPVVLSDLTKNELIRLYEYYLRDKETGREHYDNLLASADKCPFCGGLGESPKNLDHYLPKAFFSQFSILPFNLIPSCRDCNMDGKGTTYAETKEEQILHPILDQPHFFEQQWILSDYTPDPNDEREPGVFDFYTSPPDEWTDIDKARVNKHFDEFDLGLRYSKKAGAELADVLAPLKYFSSVEDFKRTNLQPVIDRALFANHWKKVMYMALMESL